jgi:prepilin-type processing-associated H-X9-DG protein
LVVVGLLGLLAGLLLPAVQKLREASRRVGCANNLRQIGLAIGVYASSFGVFPQGSNGRQAFSLHTMILPELDQRVLFNSINLQVPAYAVDAVSANLTAAATDLQVFLCPSDSRMSASAINWTNYAGNRGATFESSGLSGVFLPSSARPIGYRDLTDGSGTTAAVSEWVIGQGNLRPRDPLRVVFRSPQELAGPLQLDAFASECRGLAVASAPVSLTDKGMNWLYGELNNTLYNHILGIDEHSCTNGDAFQESAWSSGSLHPQGAHVLFADGHIAFAKESVSLAAWRAMGSRNGNDIVSADGL